MKNLTAEEVGADLAASLLGVLEIKRPGSVVEWGEANLDLPSRMSPNQPGRFSTITCPYQREPLECFHPDSGVQDVTLCFGAQGRKTTLCHVGIAFRMDQAPGPILWVTPSENFGRSWSGRAHLPLIQGNPVLARHMPANLDDFKLLEQHMDRFTMNIVGSNSPANLASRPVQIVICDEVGKFKSALGDESSPVRLAEQRTKTFGDSALRVKASTPTTVEHEFWMDFLSGSQEYYHMPCPHCGEAMVFEHRQFGLDEGKAADDAEFASLQMDNEERRYTLQWDPNARTKDGLWSLEKVRNSAFFVCPKNGCVIKDQHKAGMMLAAQYVRKNEAAPKTNRSFHVNSFYSPDVRFGDMAVQFLKGRDLFGLQDYYNGYLALPWQEMSVNLRDEKILELRDDSYRKGEIPCRGVVVITADPGEKQTHWIAQVMRDDGELIVFDWGTVLAIEDLREIQKMSWPLKNEEGKRLAASHGAIDSGAFTMRVYEFCKFSQGWWTPTKGTDAASGTWSKMAPQSHPRLLLITYVDTTAKNELYEDRIHRKNPPPIRLPGNVSSEFIHGLSGQQKLEKRTPRGVMRFWKKLPNDHYGDCLKLGVVISWVVRAGDG